jgi:glycosyltransferase involved in cell wall biosynthesis
VGIREEGVMAAQSTVLVVPCYDEEKRLDEAAILSLVEPAGLRLLFVDDGSKDGTGARLMALRVRRPERIDVLSLAQNQGKAEAVRRGLLLALDSDADVVGYIDADLATPVSEIQRLCRLMSESAAAVILASRVSLLGRRIERSTARHYLGRMFATFASLILRVAVYDTQCGAKLFRCGPALAAALRDPFLSRWVFDVELLGRLLTGAPDAPAMEPAAMREEPLDAWHDVPGSKLRPRHMLVALRDLAIIERDLVRRRASRSRALTRGSRRRAAPR